MKAILTSNPAKMSFFKKIKAELREMLNDDDEKDKKNDQGAGRKKSTPESFIPMAKLTDLVYQTTPKMCILSPARTCTRKVNRHSLTLRTEVLLRQEASCHQGGSRNGTRTVSGITMSNKPRAGHNGSHQCGREGHHLRPLEDRGIIKPMARQCHLYRISKATMSTSVHITATSSRKSKREALAWAQSLPLASVARP